MAQLRQFGIYRVPDGLLHVAVSAGAGSYFLYFVVTGVSGPPRYVVERDGKVVPWLGGAREFRVEDLEDTGQTYRS